MEARLALIDFPEKEFQELQAGLGSKYSFAQLTSSKENDSLDHEGNIDAVLVWIDTEDVEEIISRLHAIKTTFDPLNVCSICPDDFKFPMDIARQTGVWCNLNQQGALENNCSQVDRLLRFLRSEIDFELPPRLLGEGRWNHVTLVSKSDKIAFVKNVVEDFAHFTEHAGTRYQHQLCLEESLNNSLYHAFRKPGGEEKYDVGDFTMLSPSDRLDIVYGNNEQFYCLAILDNAGTLTPEIIFEKFDYHDENKSLMEERGRGLYLIRCSCKETYISIIDGTSTSFIMLFEQSPAEDGPRPLLLRYQK